MILGLYSVIVFFLLSLLNAAGLELRDEFVMILISIASILLIATFRNNRTLKKYALPLTVAYLLRMALLIENIYFNDFYALPNSSDSPMYYDASVQFALTGETKHPIGRMIGTVYRFTGPNRLLGQYIVMLFSIVTIVYCIYAIELFELAGNKKYSSIYTICVLPNFAILSACFLKESFVTMCATISVYFYLNWQQGAPTSNFVWSMAALLVGSRVHSGVIGMAGGYLLLQILYDRKTRTFNITGNNVLFATISIVIFAYIVTNYSDRFLSKMSGIDSVEDVANTNTSADSSYAQYVGNSKNILSMIVFTIPRIIYFLFSPFPWQWRGMSDIIAFFFSSCFYFNCVLRAIRFLRVGDDAQVRTEVFCLLVIAFAAAFVFGWGVSNTGTAIRHRDKLISLFTVMWALSRKDSTGQPWLARLERALHG